jgi:hypothetical protein
MTKLLEKAFAEAAKLPPEAQDALAQALLEDLKADHLWDKAFGATEADLLSNLADEAIQGHRSGNTTELDPDRL